MPSSRIIKSAAATMPISSFSFRAIARGEQLPNDASADNQNGFVALEIFDTSELPPNTGYTAPTPTAEVQPEIPGQFVSDDDLQNQLQDSYQRGLQDGKTLAERGLLNVFKGLRTAAEDLQLLREKVVRDSEDDLLALVMAISRKVVQHEVVQDRQVVLRVIRAALQELNSSDELIVRVHPDDYALLTTSQDQALRRELEAVKFTLKSDPLLTAGGCQIETALGTIDASLEAQLEELYRHLVEERTASNVGSDTSQEAQ